MSALSLRLPNSLHGRARELAQREGVSINQLVSSALAEKMSALLTEEYLGLGVAHARAFSRHSRGCRPSNPMQQTRSCGMRRAGARSRRRRGGSRRQDERPAGAVGADAVTLIWHAPEGNKLPLPPLTRPVIWSSSSRPWQKVARPARHRAIGPQRLGGAEIS